MKAILAVEDFNPMDVMTEALADIKVDFKYLPTSFEHNEAIENIESEFAEWY